MAAAIAFGAIYGARGWSRFPETCLVIFAAALALGRLVPDVALVLTLVATYAFPVLINIFHGEYYWNFNPAWSAWAFGMLLARTNLTRWSFPARWRLPLVFWALVIAVSWPIVVLREADFTPILLTTDLPPNSVAGGPPWFITGWVAGAALNWGLPLLWLDWLYQNVRTTDTARVRRLVLVPLGAGALIACVVAAYQGLVDISWMSGGQWPTIHRAPGTFMDADAFGAFAGWWSIAFLGFALSRGSPAFRILGIAGAVAAWSGLWASGSRMALAGGIIGIAFAAVPIAGWMWRERSLQRAGYAAAMFTLFAGLLFFGMHAHWSTENPLQRTIASFEAAAVRSPATFARNLLWNRGAPYGTASVMMIRESPLVGIGVGMFHTLFPDYARMLGTYATPDNAQSWYRHQLAELGVVGSLGWIAWVCLLTVFIFSAKSRSGNRRETWMARAALLAVGLISAVSMPTQHVANAFTVVVFVFWYTSLVDCGRLDVPWTRRQAWTWMASAAVVFFAGATFYMGWTHFRPPMRALRADWGYAYGFYDPEMIDGRDARWTERRAVAVVSAPTRWMKLTIWVNFSDVQEKPADVKIWKDGKLALRTRLRSTDPVVTYLRVPREDKRLMIETSTSRVMRPRDFGAPDNRELGLAVRWEFVEHPEPGFTAD